jgi:glycosyltransferase involved in cell wall biosynthesis
MTSELDLPGPPLRLAVLGDFDGLHTRRWLETFVARGHEVHAISFYAPRADLPGVALHVLSGRAPAAAAAREGSFVRLRRRLPPSLLRLLHGRRYRRAGLRQLLQKLAPDVFHAHYLVEHGFYGAQAGFHPYAVSAWGSDVLVESRHRLGRTIGAWTLARADLVTANDPAMARRLVEMGLAPSRLLTLHLGVDPFFLEGAPVGVNFDSDAAAAPPTLLSDRALEPLYNVDVVLRAFALARRELPHSELLVAGSGSQRLRLEKLAGELGLGGSLRFLGRLDAASLRQRLQEAQVYVSVPSSDSLAQSTLEAMACGTFPVVSDLPSQDGWVVDGVSGLRVPVRSPAALAAALVRALSDAGLRRNAALINRARVETEGSRLRNMLLLERHYYRLAGRPVEPAL